MDYSNIRPDLKSFFIKDYSRKAQELREKAANPKAKKAEQWLKAAEELEGIVEDLKAA